MDFCSGRPIDATIDRERASERARERHKLNVQSRRNRVAMNNGNKCRSSRRFTKNPRASDRRGEKRNDAPRCSARRLTRDSPPVGGESFENKFIFQGGALRGAFVYEKTRELEDKSEIRGLAVEGGAAEEERGHHSSFERRPLSRISVIDRARRSLISFESALLPSRTERGTNRCRSKAIWSEESPTRRRTALSSLLSERIFRAVKRRKKKKNKKKRART